MDRPQTVYRNLDRSLYFVKPGTTVYDTEVIAALESAINKNLDPKLHITISTDGIITMANQATDPWKNEYHGRYHSNAAADKLDRGVIIMYSDGANGVNGSADGIAGGLVNITTPGSNVDGKDDYALATVYTYANGYGEVKSITYGFSNNQSFGDASDVPVTPVGQAPSEVVPTPGDGTGSLPTPNLNGAIANSSSPIVYEWSELKTLAQANLSANELRDTYGIEVGDYKEVSGVKYVLVDLDGNDYDGFVFMYDTGDNGGINGDVNSNATNKGGYAKSEVAKVVDKFYTSLTDLELKQAIKPVTIICNNGSSSYSTQYEYDCHMFIASHREVGGTNHTDDQYATYIDAEGQRFDYLTSNANRKKIVNGESYFWWTRTAMPNSNSNFYSVAGGGTHTNNVSRSSGSIVATFVIG